MNVLRLLFVCALLLAFTSIAAGANDVWDTAASSFWSDNVAWLDNTAPGNNDSATFNQAGTYTVSFLVNPPAIQALTQTAGNVTFAGLGGGKTLAVNSASGTQDANLFGGGTLSLGTSGNPLHLTVGDDISVFLGSTLNVNFGSQVNAFDVLLAQTAGAGTIVVDGATSQLNATAPSISLGDNGGTATLTYRSSAQGALAAAGALNLAQSANAATVATLNVQSDADLDVGNLNIGTGAAAATGTVNVHGAGSTLDILGASTLTVGGAVGNGALNIGTTATGGAVATGTGLTTINPHGTVAIGSGANTGALTANGNVTIDGGVLTRGSGSDFTLASGRTLTIQNAGRASFTGSYTATGGTHTITGLGSKLETLGASDDFIVNAGITANVQAGGLLSVGGVLRIGGTTPGTLLVDGPGSTASAFFGVWGNDGGVANVTYQNEAAGTMSGGISVAPSATAGTTGTILVQSGADLTFGSLTVATLGGATTSGSFTVDGAGSTATQPGNFLVHIGHATSGTGTITVTNGGVFSNGAAGTTVNSTGKINILSGGAYNTSGFVGVNNTGGDGGTDTAINVNGMGSTFTQTGATGITVGTFTATTGTGTVNIGVTGSGATFTTGTSTTNIFKSGAVNIGGGANTGTLNAMGDISVSGGVLTRNLGSTFTLAPGKTMSVLSGGRATFADDYTTAANANYTISGALSKLETLNGGDFILNNGAQVNVNSDGLLSVAGNLEVGNGSNGTLSINGNGANTAFSGAATITIGHATTGTATVNIGATSSFGTLTTGTGLLTINPTGTVNIGGGSFTGTLNALGDVLVNGGVLHKKNSLSSFALTAGRTMTITGAGRATFTGGYTTANATYEVMGAGSTLETLSGGLNINNGGQVNVSAGGLVASGGASSIGSTGVGTLFVDGLTSSASSGFATWGSNGGTANVTFSNEASGVFSTSISVAGSTTAGTSATVNVQSAADITLGTLTIATSGGATTMGSVTVDGNGSTATLSGDSFVSVGHSATGIGALTASNQGLFAAGTGTTTVNSTGVIQVISGGDYTTGGDVAVNMTGGSGGAGGRINVNGAGSTFTQSGATTLTVGHAATGTGALNIGTATNGGVLTTGSGLFTINKTGTVAIGSGANAGTLIANGDVTIDGGALTRSAGSTFTLASGKTMTIQNAGTATFTGAYGTAFNAIYNITGPSSKLEGLGAGAFTVDLGAQINVLNGATLSMGPGKTTRLNGAGTININGGIADLKTLMDNGGTLNFTAGSLSYIGDLTVGFSGLLGAFLTLDENRQLTLTGDIHIDGGNFMELEGSTLTTGGLVGDGPFFFESGTLNVTGASGLAIGGDAPLGPTLILDSDRALNVSNTLTLNTGSHLVVPTNVGFSAGQIVNNGDLVAIDATIEDPLVNNNAVTVVGTVDFDGLVTGPGEFFGPGTANFNGGMAPGGSPAEIEFEGNVALAGANTLFIEIGGAAPGSQYDRLTIAGSAALDGVLNVSFINGFTPTGGQQFTILTAGSIVNNGFTLTGSAASSFNLLVDNASVILQAIGLAGDYDHNDLVDGFDFLAWQRGESPNPLSASDLAAWKANFGAGGQLTSTAVPEPSACVALLAGLAAMRFCRREVMS